MKEVAAVEIAAQYLESRAEPLVSAWVEWVREKVRTGPISSLPERALRNHIPPVLKALAGFLREPVELARQDLLGHLRLHGQVRRDQGYTLPEVLAEFDGLADLVTRGVCHAIQRRADAGPVGGQLEAATRLSTGLRAISFIAMGTFARSDEERQHLIARELEEFARAVDHELRDPLNTLTLCTRILREHELDRDQLLAQVEVMESAVRRAVGLMDTVRTLAMAEGARQAPRLVPLAQVVEKVLAELARAAAEAEVEVEVEGLLPGVSVEAVVAYIVLANVLGNAIKYHDPAKPERRVLLAARAVEEEFDSGFIELRVADNGLGIPAEYVPRVLQKGFRAHPGRSQGTGLGLYIVQEALTTRGGAIELHSEEGVGTTVELRLRCLQSAGGSLTAARFRVDHLMGEAIWHEIANEEQAVRPEPPDPEE